MTAGTRTAEPTTAALRHNRPFRLLWVGQALSSFGSSMSAVALPLVLLAAGHPVTAVAALGTAVAVAGLAVRLPAGMLSDRYDERTVLICTDLVRLVAVGALAGCLLAHTLPLWLGFVSVVVTTGAVEVFKPSQSRLVRRIVTAEQLSAAVSLNQARSYGAEIAGPAAAGMLVGVRPAVPFTVDALTFLVSALCVAAAVPARRGAPRESAPTAAPARPAGGFWDRFTAGWRYLAADPFLRRATLYFSGLTVAFTTFGTALLLGVGRQSHGATAAGWAISTAAVAGLIGSLAAPRARRHLSLTAVVAAAPAVAALLLLTSWGTGNTLVFVAAFSAMCLLVPMINASVGTVMATSVPEEIYGRVATANDFVVQLLQPCGPLVAGLLVTRSLSLTALVLAGGFAVLAALALALPAPGAAAPAGPAPEHVTGALE